MRITLEDVKKNAQLNNLKWLKESKTRIKLIIKQNIIDDKTIEYLWEEVTLRRALVKNQKLEIKLIEYIFNKTYQSKKRFISSSVFKETLLNQEIPDSLIEDTKDLMSRYVVEMWQTIPGKMIDVLSLDNFKKFIHYDQSHQEITSAIAAIVRYDETLLEDVINICFEFDERSLYDTVNVLAKIIYFEDELISQLYSEINSMMFYSIFQTLISRSNCSYVSQAKYLLNK